LVLGDYKPSDEPYEIEFFALNADSKPAADATIIKVKVVKKGKLPATASAEPKTPAAAAKKPAAAVTPQPTQEPAKPAASAEPKTPVAAAEKPATVAAENPAAAAEAPGGVKTWVVSNPEEPAKPATKPAK